MLSQKILLRKPGTGMAVLALALLVAIITSMNSVVNYINARSEALVGLGVDLKRLRVIQHMMLRRLPQA
ncbi:MAG: hypothetical protein QW096_09225 [Thermofilaceae archaeon]